MIFSSYDFENLESWEEFNSILKKKGVLIIKNLIAKEKAIEIKEIMQNNNSSHEFLETVALRNKYDFLEVYNNKLFLYSLWNWCSSSQ